MRSLINLENAQKKLPYPLHGLGVIILFFLSVLLWGQVLCAQPTKNLIQEDEVKLVWSADYGHGEQVFFSSFEKNTWTSPVQLSDSTELVFHSAISSGDDGRIWAVWSRQDKKKSFLEFTIFSSSKWVKPRKINTGLDNNKSVTVIVDKNNIPWIAWAGVEDKYPDVFWSRWNGQRWDLPVKVHADNDVPDINPALVLDDSGYINLSWQTFADGKYVTVSKTWDGQQWQVSSLDSEKVEINTIFAEHKIMPNIPEFINDRRRATFFIKGNDGAGSIPLSKQ